MTGLNVGEHEMYVPVIPNGNNKILYIVEYNSDWEGTGHGNIWIND